MNAEVVPELVRHDVFHVDAVHPLGDDHDHFRVPRLVTATRVAVAKKLEGVFRGASAGPHHDAPAGVAQIDALTEDEVDGRSPIGGGVPAFSRGLDGLLFLGRESLVDVDGRVETPGGECSQRENGELRGKVSPIRSYLRAAKTTTLNLF